tara:strand:+ start:22210 stop:22506 length:297 start_codon:yes stop_codon:yes gene_type:complete
MLRSLSHIKLLTVAAILIGFALATVHHDDVTIQTGELIVEIGNPDCSMCDGTVKIDNDVLTLSSPELFLISEVSDRMVNTPYLPFARIIKDRAPPSRA